LSHGGPSVHGPRKIHAGRRWGKRQRGNGIGDLAKGSHDKKCVNKQLEGKEHKPKEEWGGEVGPGGTTHREKAPGGREKQKFFKSKRPRERKIDERPRECKRGLKDGASPAEKKGKKNDQSGPRQASAKQVRY